MIASMRWRMQLWHGVLLVVVLTGFGLTAYGVAREQTWRRVDRDLESQFGAFFGPPPGPPPPMEISRREGMAGPPMGQPGRRFGDPAMRERVIQRIRDGDVPQGYFFALWDAGGSLLAKSPDAPHQLPPPPPVADTGRSFPRFGELASVRTRGDLREGLQIMPFREVLLVGRAVGVEQAAMRRLATMLFAGGLAILALGLAGGWWIATQSIRPVAAISQAAAKIADGDLSQRIDATGTVLEFAPLVQVLNSTFSRLEASFAQQARFTADASHELRTPITVMLSQTQTALARERTAEEYRESLEACQRAAQRMRRLTESLLALARLDAGEDPLRLEAIDFARVARDCVESVRPLADAKQVAIHCELPSLPCRGDADRLGQVVTNLLQNAIQSNRAGGEVRLSAESTAKTVSLSVRDTGEGIRAEDLPRIFERFYRADPSRSRPNGRTGLGLAISKAIVDAHHGEIRVVSQPGAGSTVTIALPR
ncbi:MAG: HAMP domain-containing protein [Bryobacterales bacterium]|nr:HAMP domain-containing protein [Bryobacterales bacterium]